MRYRFFVLLLFVILLGLPIFVFANTRVNSSSYSLLVEDLSDIQDVFTGDTFLVAATYSNLSDLNSIFNSTNVSCSIQFNSNATNYNMTYLSSQPPFGAGFFKTINATANLSNFSVSCLPTNNSYVDSINASENITVYSARISSSVTKNPLLGTLFTTGQNMSFFANYTTVSNATLPTASCSISFGDGSLNNLMTYDSGLSLFEYNRSFSVFGLTNYTVNCSYPGISNRTLIQNLSIIENRPFFSERFNSANSDLQDRYDSRLAFVRLNESSNVTNLIQCGGQSPSIRNFRIYSISTTNTTLIFSLNYLNISECSFSIADIYRNNFNTILVLGLNSSNNETGFVANITSSLISGNQYPSLALVDAMSSFYQRDVQSYFVAFGKNSSILQHISTSATSLFGNLTLVRLGFISFIKNTVNDIAILTGLSSPTLSTQRTSEVYLLNSSNIFSKIESITPVSYSSGSCGRIFNNLTLYCVVSGLSASGNITTIYQVLSNGSFASIASLPGISRGATRLVDVNNDGWLDLALIGTPTINLTQFIIYLNDHVSGFTSNITTYVPNALGVEHQASMDIADIDLDGDMDVAVSGVTNSFTPYTAIWTNNMSLWNPNYPPDKMSAPSVNYSNGQLVISWNNGSDDKTPPAGLTYNINVGTTPTGSEIVSGKIGVSTSDTMLAMGNMQYLNAINFTVPPQTYYVKVQALDTSLRVGNWSDITIYSPASCQVGSTGLYISDVCTLTNLTQLPADTNVIISNSSASLTISNAQIQLNASTNNSAGIQATNGTLILRGVNISNQNSSNWIVVNLTSVAALSDVNIVNATVYVSNSSINLTDVNIIGNLIINSNQSVFENISATSITVLNNATLTNASYQNITVTSGVVAFKKQFFTVIANQPQVNLLINKSSYAFNQVVNQTTLLLNISNITAAGEVFDSIYTINLSKRRFFPFVTFVNVSSQNSLFVSLNATGEPYWDQYENIMSTNLTNYALNSSLGSATLITLGIPGIGYVTLNGPLNLTGLNLSQIVQLANDSIYVNGSALNTSAHLSFQNRNYAYGPVIFSDGQACTICTGYSYLGNVLTFDVPHFTNYSFTANSNLIVTPATSYFKFAALHQINFSLNYSNVTSLLPVSGAICSVNLTNGSLSPAIYNASSQTYDAVITFNASGTFAYTARCNASTLYESQNVTQSITIHPDSGEFSDSGISFTGLGYPSLIDYNNTEYLFGETAPSSYSAFMFNNSSVAALSASYSRFSRGFIVASDFRHTGELDFIVPGTGSNPQVYWVKNVTGMTTISAISGATISAIPSSATLLDVNNDDYEDVFITPGPIAGTSLLLINDAGNGFNVTTVPYGLVNPQVLALDINSDNYTDILMTGENTTTNATVVVLQNLHNSTFSINSSTGFDKIARGPLSVINPRTNQILLSGINNSNGGSNVVGTTVASLFNTNPSISFNQSFGNYSRGSSVVADFNGDGSSDIFLNGLQNLLQNSTNSSLYLFSQNTFNLSKSFAVDGLFFSSVIAFDYQNDGDLDLLVSGQNASDVYVTKLFVSDYAYYSNNSPPTAPTPLLISQINDSTNTASNLSFSWTGASDDHTSTSDLTYNFRLGTLANKNKFISGVASSSSNPTVQFRGNMLNKNTTTYTGAVANQCMFYGVQAYDSGLAASNWSEKNLSYPEVCDGYDNNCDGLVDENWDANQDGFVQNVPACAAYLAVHPEKVDPCDSTTGTINQDGSKSCPTAISPLKNTGGGGGGGGAAPGSVANIDKAIADATKTPSTDTAPTTPAQIPSAPAPDSTAQSNTDSSSKVSRDITLDYRDGKTYVTEIVRNTQRTLVNQMTVRKEFPKSILNSTNYLKSITQYTIIQTDPIVDFDLGKMNYLEEKPLVYSIPGEFTISEIRSIITTIDTRQELTQEQIIQKENNEIAKANESLITNVTEAVVDNGTQITISLNLTQNVTSVQGVEVEQYIPKCLLKEINQTVLEAGVDKSQINNVHIKQADPIIVWNLQEVDAKTQLILKLNALRASDCNDEIKIKTLAKEYIRANYEINSGNLTKSFALTIAVMLFFILIFVLSEYISGDEEENSQLDHIVQIAMHYQKEGKSVEQIKALLLSANHSPTLVDDAISRLSQNKLRDRSLLMRAVFSHSITVFMFIVTFILDGVEFVGLLPGYLEWIKTVISWTLVLIMFYEIDLPKLVFNNSKRWINITLLLGMFLLHLKALVAYAKSQSLDDHTYFIFDLYAFVLNHAQFFSVTLFYIGSAAILIAAIAMAWKLDVKEGCLYFTFTNHPIAHTVWQKIKRSLKLFGLYMFFAFAVFNRVVEWLAVAIDTTIFMITLVVLLLVLASTTFLHYHKPFKRRGLEVLVQALTQNSIWILLFAVFIFAFIEPFFSTFVSQGVMAIFASLLLVIGLYTIITGFKDHFSGLEHISSVIDNVTAKFIRLFSHPSTIFLGISGIFLLQHIAELAIYIIPNITGETNSAYSQLSAGTLLGLFSHQSIIAAHLFRLDLLQQLTFGGLYAISILGGIFLFIVPLVVWALYFMHRNEHPSRISVKELFFEKAGAFKKLCSVILIFSVPSIIILMLTKVLTISYLSGLTDNTDVGVVISASTMTLTADQVMLLIIGFVTYIWIAALLYKEALTNDKVKSQLVSITLGVSFASLIYLYLTPYVESIFAYIGVLCHTIIAFGEPTASIIVLLVLILLFICDLLFISVAGLLILIFFGLPREIKKRVVEELSHIPFFHHLFFLAGSLSHIDYYEQSSKEFGTELTKIGAQEGASNKPSALVNHVAKYIESLENGGHHLEVIIYQLKIHGYPQNVIDAAILQLSVQNKFAHTVETLSAQHISVHQVKRLIPLIRREMALSSHSSTTNVVTQQEIYELFLEKFTYPEIKLALIYVSGNLSGDVTIERVKEQEDALVNKLLIVVKKMLLQNKNKKLNQSAKQSITSDLISQGYDPELVIKILNHPLLNAEEANTIINEIVQKLLVISKNKKMSAKNSAQDLFVSLLNSKYPYQLLAKALDSPVCKKNQLCQTIKKGVVWSIAATSKGWTKEQIVKTLTSRSWRADIAGAIYDYAIFVKQNAHRVDQIIEKSYIQLEE